jgi:methyl-accepting chemotaxis protein
MACENILESTFFLVMHSSQSSSLLGSITDNAFIRFLNNRSIAGKITLLVVPIFLLALSGLVSVSWTAFKQYQRSKTLQQANVVSDFIIKAASEQAKERGFTATVLSNPNDKLTLTKIITVRKTGDAFLDSALYASQNLVSENTQANEKFLALQEQRTKRNELRQRADVLLGTQAEQPEQITAWIGAQTRLILAERSFANALFASQNSLEAILEFNSQVKNSVLNASEFAGRERANIGTVISSGQPIPPERLNVLMQYRGVVQENVELIVEYGKNPHVSASIRESINSMQRIFMQEFEQTRTSIYSASKNGEPYPITTAEWITRSTKGINSILAVSDAVSIETQRLAQEEFSSSYRVFILSVIALVVLLIVLIVAYALSRSIISRLLRLRFAAKNIAQGDFSAMKLSQDRDEIGDVGVSFAQVLATMQQFSTSQQEVLDNTLQGNMAARADISVYQGGFRTMAEGINSLLDAVNRPTQDALQVLQYLADGDFRQRMTGEYRGDHALLKNAINATIDAITDALDNVLQTAHHILQGAGQVASASQSLSQGSVEQAASLEEITSSLQMIASQISHTAHEATSAAGMTSSSRTAAERGNTEMQRLMTAMQDINTSSKNIAGIIRVIDEIAFQTNLLSLNAAIEAARAGRYGKGFAVVAEEVRSLAGRSAKAARQTASLIEEAVGNASLGSTTADETAQRLQEITLSSNKVAVVVNEIAASAQSQATGIGEINSGLHQIDKVVQMTAANAEECAAAAHELETQAKNLSHILATFKLNDTRNSALYRLSTR